MTKFTNTPTKSAMTARIFATFAEFFMLAMVILGLTGIINVIYLNYTAGSFAGFLSLSIGSSAMLVVAALVCIVPAIGCFSIAYCLDEEHAGLGYLFEFLFSTVENFLVYSKSATDKF